MKVITIIFFLFGGLASFANDIKQVPKENTNLIECVEKLTNSIVEHAFNYYCKPFVELFVAGVFEYMFEKGPERVSSAAENYYIQHFKYQKDSDQYIFDGKLSNNLMAYPQNAALSSDKSFLLVFRGIKDKLSSGEPFHFCYFQIYKHISGNKYKLNFTCKDKWRIFDFKGFLWENGKVKVISGDIGTCFYVQEGSKWVKKYE